MMIEVFFLGLCVVFLSWYEDYVEDKEGEEGRRRRQGKKLVVVGLLLDKIQLHDPTVIIFRKKIKWLKTNEND